MTPPKSDVPPTLGITPEMREKLDREIEEAEKTLPSRPKPQEPPPAPVKESAFYAKVQACISGDADADDTPRKKGLGHRMVEIEKVVIPSDREPDGDIDGLMASIQEVGLINPITLTESLRLVAGRNRYEACLRLGWTEIEATVLSVDAFKATILECDENLVRKNLTPIERGEILEKRKRAYEALHPDAKVGGLPGKPGGGKRRIPKDERSASFAEDTEKRTGLGMRTIQQDVQVVAKLPRDIRDKLRKHAAGQNKSDLLKLVRIKSDEKKRELTNQVVKGKYRTFSDAIRAMKNRERHEASGSGTQTVEDEGPLVFSLVLADPAWQHEHVISESRDINQQHYRVMTLEAICALKVGDVAADDSMLFLWTPMPKIEEACRVLHEWGFSLRTGIIWAKVSKLYVTAIAHLESGGKWEDLSDDQRRAVLKGGLVERPGYYCIQSSELLLIASKGRPLRPAIEDRPYSVIFAPCGDHSEKPAIFYETIERMYPRAAKVEMWARQRRTGWVSMGNEIDGRNLEEVIGTSVDPPVPRADGLASASEPSPDSATAPSSPCRDSGEM